MATKKFDVVMGKPDPRNEHKQVWLKLGVAFLDEHSETGMLDIKIDMLPLRNGQTYFPDKIAVFLKRGKDVD